MATYQTLQHITYNGKPYPANSVVDLDATAAAQLSAARAVQPAKKWVEKIEIVAAEPAPETAAEVAADGGEAEAKAKAKAKAKK